MVNELIYAPITQTKPTTLILINLLITFTYPTLRRLDNKLELMLLQASLLLGQSYGFTPETIPLIAGITHPLNPRLLATTITNSLSNLLNIVQVVVVLAFLEVVRGDGKGHHFGEFEMAGFAHSEIALDVVVGLLVEEGGP